MKIVAFLNEKKNRNAKKGVGRIQKVNVFIKYPKGETTYKSKACLSSTTVFEIIDSCGLSRLGARVYLEGSFIPESRFGDSLAKLKAKNPAFMSIKYGDFESNRKN